MEMSWVGLFFRIVDKEPLKGDIEALQATIFMEIQTPCSDALHDGVL